MEKGTTISHYTILEKLGEGGMGVVYKARDTKLDREVALKFLPQHLTSSEEDKQRFIREAKAAAALNHPNICTIHSVDEHEGSQFIVMEYIDGNTLRDLQKSGNLEPVMAIDYTVQIAKALSKAHDAGIIHRDIKPGNIMVNADGHIKVMDFGLAKLKGSSEEITKTGSTVGTMAYMAPEQIQGKEVDHRADIFSFGVVFFEMLTGTRPFRSEHEAALMYSIVNEEPEPVSRYVSGIDPDLVSLIGKLLEKNPEDRYQSVDPIISELRQLELDSSQNVRTQDPEPGTERLPADDDSQTTGSDSVTITIPGFRSRTGISITLITIIALAGAVYFAFFSEDEEILVLNEERVLVAPFENRTGDTSLDPLGRSAADWITEGILQSGVVEAVQTTTTLQLIGEGDLAGGGLEGRSRHVELAGHTNAGVLVSGRFIQIGEDIRFETQIIDAQKNEVIYTLDPVRGPRSDPMEVINELQQNILGVLSIHVYPGSNLQFFESPPLYEAYIEYMDGLKFFHRDYGKSIEFLQRALEIDPGLLQAKLFKGWAYYILGQPAEADALWQSVDAERVRLSPYNEYYLEFSLHRLAGNFPEAFETARQWRGLAPRDQLANYLIGSHALFINRPQKTVDTYSEFELSGRFIEDAPGGLLWFRQFARAYHFLGEHEKELEKAREGLEYFPEDLIIKRLEVNALAALGEIEKVYNAIEESKAIDDPTLGSAGSVMLWAAMEFRAHGHKQVSLELAAETAAWYREQEPFTLNQVHSLTYAEVWAEAYEMAKELTADEPGNVEYLGQLGVLAALLGNYAEASRIEQALAEIDRDYLYGEHLYQRARIKALLGEQQETVQLLEASFEQGKPFHIGIHRDIAFEPLKGFDSYEQVLEPKE